MRLEFLASYEEVIRARKLLYRAYKNTIRDLLDNDWTWDTLGRELYGSGFGQPGSHLRMLCGAGGYPIRDHDLRALQLFLRRNGRVS